MAVRRGPPDRRQAGAVRRLGVRRAPAGQGPGQPQVAAGGAHAVAAAEPQAGRGARRARRRASRCRCRRRRRPGARRPRGRASPTPAAPPAPKAGAAVNDLLPFLDFVEHHPVGSSVNGVVESYSSHGAYVSIGDLRGYVPLRLMGDPPPRSAREVMKIGDAVTLVVTSFAPARRSVDLAVPHVAPVAEVQPTPELEELAEAVAPARRASKRAAKKAVAGGRRRRGKAGRRRRPTPRRRAGAEAAEPPPAKKAAREGAGQGGGRREEGGGRRRRAAKRTTKKAAAPEPPSTGRRRGDADASEADATQAGGEGGHRR